MLEGKIKDPVNVVIPSDEFVPYSLQHHHSKSSST